MSILDCDNDYKEYLEKLLKLEYNFHLLKGLQNQPHRFGPRLIEEQWPELLKARKLFPLLAILRFESGPERFRFEVNTVTPEKIEDRDGKLFQPPPGYQEIQPLPF